MSKVAAGRSFVKCCLLLDAKDNSLYGLCGRVIYWDAMSSFGIWEKMDCLALLLSLFFCCLLSALLSIPPAVPSFPHPSVSLEVLPVYFPASPFAILIFPLCFKISLLSPVDDISFSESLSSLWIPSHPFSSSPRNSRVNETVLIVILQSPHWRGLAFSFSWSWCLAGWTATNLTPWPGLWLLWQT